MTQSTQILYGKDISSRENSILVAFGANLGNRRETLERAAKMLVEELEDIGELGIVERVGRPETRLVAMSSFRETEPVLRNPEDPPVPWYLNAVGWFATTEPVERFFERMMAIEQRLGRQRKTDGNKYNEGNERNKGNENGERGEHNKDNENSEGGENSERGENTWRPRTCDLDLLLAGTFVRNDAWLTVPHPRMTERRFVLEPAAEIAPEMVHPILGETIGELWSKMKETESSRRRLDRSDHRERFRQRHGSAHRDATCYVAPPGGPSESRRRPGEFS